MAYSAFQSNAFQANCFQILRNGATPDNRDTHDGFDDKLYRKYLEKITKISEDRERKKYAPVATQINKLIAKTENLILVKSLEAVVQVIRQPEFDYDKAARMAAAAVARLDAILAYYDRLDARRRKDEEEIIILLSML